MKPRGRTGRRESGDRIPFPTGGNPASGPSIRELLSGGDLRSIGRVPEVVGIVGKSPERMAELVRELVCPDPVVRSRAADALEKATAGRADLLNPYKEVILRVAAGSLQQEVRWHMAQIVPRLPLTRRQVRGAFSILRGYLRDRSVIVRVCALQTMVDLALRDPALQAPAKAMVAEACRTGTAAIRARVRKLLVLLEEKADGL